MARLSTYWAAQLRLFRLWSDDVDPLVFGALAVVAIALFVTVRFPDDLAHGQTEAPAAVANHPPPRVQDFAYVFNYARRAAERPGTSPYGMDSHRAFLDAWLGPSVRSALCFAYGPAMVLLLAPLFPLTTRWAWLVWNLCGAWLGAWSVARLAHQRTAVRSATRLCATGMTAFHCLVNGQTAIAATAGFVVLIRRGRRKCSIGDDVAHGFTAAALAAKPPLAAVAIVALLLARRGRAALTGVAMMAAVAVLALVWWTPAIVWDYASLIHRYNLTDADALMRAGLVPRSMSNLRGILLNVWRVQDSRAFFMSGWAFGLALGAPLAIVALRPHGWSSPLAMSYAIMVYLLFVPHLTPTEDFLALVPLAALPVERRLGSVEWGCLVAGAVGPQWVNATTAQLVGGSAPGDAASATMATAAFALKCLVAAVVLRHFVTAGWYGADTTRAAPA